MSETIDKFHVEYYNSGVWHHNTYYLGVPTQKCPLDLWLYQELIHRIKPDFIIETGTAAGGSALFMAHVCDQIHKGKVISIDVNPKPSIFHDRLSFLTGNSASIEIIEEVKRIVGQLPCLVILDSNHSTAHVLSELQNYSQFVPIGSYIIVEDTNINGHPVLPNWGIGPYEAMEKFLSENKNFEIDLSCEKFLLTFNPSGFLKRVS